MREARRPASSCRDDRPPRRRSPPPPKSQSVGGRGRCCRAPSPSACAGEGDGPSPSARAAPAGFRSSIGGRVPEALILPLALNTSRSCTTRRSHSASLSHRFNSTVRSTEIGSPSIVVEGVLASTSSDRAASTTASAGMPTSRPISWRSASVSPSLREIPGRLRRRILGGLQENGRHLFVVVASVSHEDELRFAGPKEKGPREGA